MMRRAPVLVTFLSCSTLATAFLIGCAGAPLRPKQAQVSLEEIATDANFVSKYTQPYGLKYVQVEAVSLATGLAGTGGDPPPTFQRAALMDEMKRRQIENPNAVLASADTALVILRGYLPPGVREGDRIDIEVQSPSRSETSSLRGGWVLPARMTELAVLGQQIRAGHVLAMAQGAILVDPSADGDDGSAAATKGRILGGGLALKSRPLGLVIGHEYRSVRLATDIAKAVNDRFYQFKDGRKRGIATPETDEYIEIDVHERYHDNITRLVKVIREIPINESAVDRQERLLTLQKQLLDPLTAPKAALRLEAIGGDQVVEILRQGAASDDVEVRFYSAEALAYLDDTAAVKPLALAARDEPAFRVNALAALSTMDDVVAYDELRALLNVKSAETRYGAFRSLWVMNASDPLVRGEQLGGGFTYHMLDVPGPDMIHVTHSRRPEIVMFGTDQHFRLPLVADAGKNILVNGLNGNQVTVSKFVTGGAPQKRVVSTSVDEVIRAIVELGGSYPDVVQALQQAKHDGALASRFEVDALPEGGRSYARKSEDDDTEVAEEHQLELATPLPDLFSDIL